jgi:hypothetical protein
MGTLDRRLAVERSRQSGRRVRRSDRAAGGDRLPTPRAIDHPYGLSEVDWLKAVQDLRTSILQGLGGLAVLLGAVVAALNLREARRQNRAVQEQNREVLELQRRELRWQAADRAAAHPGRVRDVDPATAARLEPSRDSWQEVGEAADENQSA